MPLPREAWQEESLEPGSQDLPQGSDPQVAPNGMTEEPDSAQGMEAISDTTSPSTGEGVHHLEWSYQVIHSNSAQNTPEVNLDAATLASPGGEDHNVPSQSSRLIPEYENLRTSGLGQRKYFKINTRGKKEYQSYWASLPSSYM